MVESFEFMSDLDKITMALSSKKTVTIASDGGLKETQGTFGWLLAKSLIYSYRDQIRLMVLRTQHRRPVVNCGAMHQLYLR